MESPNLHHHHHHQQQQQQQQLQDDGQLVIQSSSPLSTSTPSCFAIGSSHANWTPNTFLNGGNFHLNINGGTGNSRDPKQQYDNTTLVSSLNGPMMIQDLGFHQWAHHDLQNSRIKEEFSDAGYPKFSEMISSPSSSTEDLQLQQQQHPTINSYMKNNEQRDLNNKLLLKSFSSGCQINGIQIPQGEWAKFAQNASPSRTSRGTFSQILPTINISSFNNNSSNQSVLAMNSNSLEMNMDALDLFNSARFSGSSTFSHQPNSQDHHLGLLNKDNLPYGLDRMQQLSHRPSVSPSKVISPFANGFTEAKRPSSSSMEPKATHQAAPKKSRVESRASCPPFKVRKEKLGDRIASLQQLVAPFGKTDTASVLMEAIGYIKFLQNQVETLSVPYMKSSHTKASSRTTMQEGSTEDGCQESSKRDLRSRGLCLMPLSCLSFVTDGGGGIWPAPPNFSGGT